MSRNPLSRTRSRIAGGVALVTGAVVFLPAIHADAQETRAAPSAVGGFVYPAPGQTTGIGKLPASAADSEYLGSQNYNIPTARDLGFSGVVNGQSVWTYGDTLVRVDNNWALSASDSVGLGDRADPLRVYDTNVNSNGWPQQWIPLTAAEQADGGLSRYAEGGTNVVEYAPNHGLVWFLKNDRGSNGAGIVGAGVATVTADGSGAVATRTMDTMWLPIEPAWGDIGVTYNPSDQSVYVYGHGPGALGTNVYLAKVPAARATDVSAYQYWDQSIKGWTNRRFTTDGRYGTVKITDAQAIFTNRTLGQSNAFWSNHYNTWMFVAGADVGYTDVMVMTAPALEGPWTTAVTIVSTCPAGSCGSIRYAVAPHPEYDPTGRTLLVTWTDDNVIHSTRIRWK